MWVLITNECCPSDSDYRWDESISFPKNYQMRRNCLDYNTRHDILFELDFIFISSRPQK